jgi:replicative DNA helicase
LTDGKYWIKIGLVIDFEYPFDELAERAVLGAMIKDPENIPVVLEHLREEDFYLETHRILFSVLYKVWDEKGKDWDDIVLKNYLERMHVDDKISMSLVYELAQEAAEGHLLFEAIKSVKEKAGIRKLMDLAIEVLRNGKENPDFNVLVERVSERVHEISLKHQTSQFYHIKKPMDAILEFIDQRRKAERLITGLSTGFLDLDKLTAGFQPTELVVVAARPGMGKSSFMLSLVLHLALNENVPLAIFSLEMSKEQLAMRMVSMLSGVPLQNLRQGFVSDDDWEKVVDAALKISSKEIYVEDNPNLTTTELRIRSRKLKKEKGVGIIFVDYLQLLGVPYRRSSRQEEVAEISKSLKALAKELSIPVVALAQLSRQVEQRSDKRPQLADLRESGQIEQDADLIIFIHRPEYYKKNPPPEEEGVAEIIVAKQRQGPTGIIKLAFNKDTTAFAPLPYVDVKGVEAYEPEEEDGFSPEEWDF